MAIYAYKITRDYGFAPNPFGEFCTLACCKPNVRKKANVGDWIIGTGAKANGLLYHVIFIMKVTEKITFQNYWEDQKFSYKKPVLNGSLKQLHGDNIYYNENNEWYQIDSHHSLHDGQINIGNLKQDLSGKYVLVSNHFIYLGKTTWEVPDKYLDVCPGLRHRDYITIKNESLAEEMIEIIKGKYELGINDIPVHWKEYEQKKLF